MNFSDYLKQLRESRGLSVRQLAQRSGLSPSYLSKVERGAVGRPKASTVDSLSEALELNRREEDRLRELSGRDYSPEGTYSNRPISAVVIAEGAGLASALAGLKQHSDRVTALVWPDPDVDDPETQAPETNDTPESEVATAIAVSHRHSDLVRELLSHRIAGEGTTPTTVQRVVWEALAAEGENHAARVSAEAKVFGLVSGDRSPVQAISQYWARLADVPSNSTLGHSLDSLTLVPEVQPPAAVLARLQAADLIVLGPGRLYGGIARSLLVPRVREFILDSQAAVVYVCSLTTDSSTAGRTASEFVRSVQAFLGSPDRLDAVIVGTPEQVPATVLENMQREGRDLVTLDLATLHGLGPDIFVARVPRPGSEVIYDPTSLGSLLDEIARSLRIRRHNEIRPKELAE